MFRGAHKGQGATARREGLAPLSSNEAFVPLGTFGERLRLARSDQSAQLW